MKNLIKYMKPYVLYAIIAPILMLIEVVCDLMQPTLMAEIVDKGILNKDIHHIISIGLAMIGITLIGMVGGIGCTIFASIAAQSFGADVRVALFKKIHSFSFKNLDRYNTASLVTRLTNDIVQIQNFVLMLLRIMVRSPLLVIGGIVMAVSINRELAMILIITIPLLIGVIVFIVKRGFPLFSKVQEKLDNLNGVIRENLVGIRVIKVFVREKYEKKRFEKANGESRDVTAKASKIMGSTMPLMMLIMNFSIIAVIWFGGVRVNSGNMRVGHIIAFITYVTQILISLMMMAFLFSSVSRAKVSADRIGEIFETEVDIEGDETSNKKVENGKVEFKNVTFLHDREASEPVLKNISFKCESGENIAIIGSTGAGKSTLVNLIPRFYDAQEGEILIDGNSIKEYSLEELRGAVSVVLQETVLFSGTIMENLRWGDSSCSEEEIYEAAKAAEAHNFITSFTDGYNTVIGQRGVNLSGGQKQRISIARAILKKPKILILDDSTSAVDMGTEARIQKAMRNILPDTTRITIAQRINSVKEADKIIVLENGEISGMGTHEELMENNKVYQDIYSSQLCMEDEECLIKQ